MDQLDIERIARTIVREYGLPLRLESLCFERAGECVVRFSERYAPAATVSVGIWCNPGVSPYSIRESLKRALDVSD